MNRLLTFALAVTVLGHTAVARAALPIRPGQVLSAAISGGSAAAQNPPAKSRQMKSQEEADAFQALQGENDPHLKLSRAQAFLQQYPQSEAADVAWFQVMLAQHALGDRAKSIDAGRKAVQANPDFTYAFFDLGLENVEPEPLDLEQGVWNMARAVALARATQDKSAPEFEKVLTQVYVDYHGSPEGLRELIDQASGSPSSPAGFQIPGPPLYGPKGVTAESVRQGGLGSCYFHSTVAAFARWNSQAVREMIADNHNGTYTVLFPDGKKVNVYAEDLRFARLSRFELSDGQWVGVLLRAYAQRELREALLGGIESSDMFALIKPYAASFVESTDPLLLAYDRAIRAVVDQAGDIDKAKLAARLKDETKGIPIPDQFKDSMLSTLQSGGVFDAVAAMVKQNGELFGAYRAVGHGGIPAIVMHNLMGAKAAALDTKSREDVAGFLAQAVPTKQPIVAATGDLPLQTLQTRKGMPPDAGSWYVLLHAYTVIGYDPKSNMVTLRNPWGSHPDPDGTFTIPLSAFTDSFEVIQTVAN